MNEQSNEVTQRAAIGSNTTQIGVQNNYSGLTINDALTIAFDLFREYYPKLKDEAIAELANLVRNELDKIKQNDLLPPRAKTVIPLLQNASITEESNLRKMYAKILAGDMNKQTRQNVHPAYIEIINQMSSDDAALFKRIVEINNSIPVARVTFIFDTKYLTKAFPHYFSPYFDGFDPQKASLSMENLSRLNVINLFDGNVTGYNYDNIKAHPYVSDRFAFAKEHNPTRNLSIEINKYVIQMNDFGRNLAMLCF